MADVYTEDDYHKAKDQFSQRIEKISDALIDQDGDRIYNLLMDFIPEISREFKIKEEYLLKKLEIMIESRLAADDY